jgi:hypothetical protein
VTVGLIRTSTGWHLPSRSATRAIDAISDRLSITIAPQSAPIAYSRSGSVLKVPW